MYTIIFHCSFNLKWSTFQLRFKKPFVFQARLVIRHQDSKWTMHFVQNVFFFLKNTNLTISQANHKGDKRQKNWLGSALLWDWLDKISVRIREYVPHNILVYSNEFSNTRITLWLNACKIWSQLLWEIKFEISSPKHKLISSIIGPTWSFNMPHNILAQKIMMGDYATTTITNFTIYNP